MNAYTKSMKVYSYINSYTHKQAIYSYTPISIYEGEKAGMGGRGSKVRFLHLGGNGIIVFSYISVEGRGKGWKGG